MVSNVSLASSNNRFVGINNICANNLASRSMICPLRVPVEFAETLGRFDLIDERPMQMYVGQFFDHGHPKSGSAIA